MIDCRHHDASAERKRSSIVGRISVGDESVGNVQETLSKFGSSLELIEHDDWGESSLLCAEDLVNQHRIDFAAVSLLKYRRWNLKVTPLDSSENLYKRMNEL